MDDMTAPEQPTPDYGNLARHVKQRRDELGLTADDVAARGGPGRATLSKMENAHTVTYRPSVLRDLDRALGWIPGSARSCLNGGEPLGTHDTGGEWLFQVFADMPVSPRVKLELLHRLQAQVLRELD